MCSTCPNCQQRMRFNAQYQKYLKEAGNRADVEWVAQMMKTDKERLFCLKELLEEERLTELAREWAHHNL